MTICKSTFLKPNYSLKMNIFIGQVLLTLLNKIQIIKNINRMSVLYFWGKPITKHLFQNNSKNQSVAVFDKRIDQISSGQKHCVILMDHQIFGFGDNSEGQLGNNQQENEQGLVRILFQKNKRILQVSCGWNHTLILDQDGYVYSSGRGDHGQLGRGQVGKFNSFQFVLKEARQISAGKDHSLALCHSKVMGWGSSKNGQLGLLSKKNYYYPHELNVYPANYIFAGSKYSLFVTSKGVFGTGANQNCQLGLGHQNDVQVPRRLTIQDEIISISGGNYCAAKTVKNQWYLWGSGGFGVFKYPTKMSFLVNGESVAMGLNFGLLSKNGKVWVWGSNKWGQLGIQSQFKDYAYEAQQFGNLGLQSYSCGCNFMVGYANQGQDSFSNEQDDKKVSQCQQSQQSSISKQLFRNFQKSSASPSQITLKQKNQTNQWGKFYEIQHQYDIIEIPKRQAFNRTSQQKETPKCYQHQSNQNAYMTWYGQNNYKRRVKLSQSLKSLTNYRWNNLEQQNSSLKERLQFERIQKQKIKREYLHLLNMNEDNKIYNKILKLQNKIQKKSNKSQFEASNSQFDSFTNKLNTLKQLIESACQ